MLQRSNQYDYLFNGEDPSKTGLKYLCKTTRNPYTYNGSGVDWKIYLRNYGTAHTTEIIRECHSKEELNIWGRYYSRLWNVVGAMDDFGNKIWANKIPETGGGGLTGADNPMADPKIKAKHLIAVKIANQNTSMVATRTKALKKVFATVEHKKIRSTAQTIAQNKPEVVNKRSKTMLLVQNDPVEKAKRSGANSHWYDNTIYTFRHSNGTIEECTRQEFQLKYKFTAQYVRHIINRPGQYTKLGWSREVEDSIARDVATII
jgi:hypothetical protein